MYQLKLIPQLVCGVAGSRSWDSGIASSAVQPSASISVRARHTGFQVESRLPSVSSVWIQSARTPAAVTAKLYATRRVCDGSIDTMNRSAPPVSSRAVSASSMSPCPADHIRAAT
jgi:hypothetical protein